MTTKTQMEIDFDINSKIKIELSKQKKMGEQTQTKERHFGLMVERQHQIESLCAKKGITHDQLINLIKKHDGKN